MGYKEQVITRRFRWILAPQFWILIGAIVMAFLHIGGTTQSSGLARAQLQVFATPPKPSPPPKPHLKPVPPVNCKKVHCIALTFDDGPNPVTTPQILSVLERERVKATFFVVGTRVHGSEAIIRRMYADGNEIGNHSWSHPNLTQLKPAQIKQQVAWTQQAVIKAGVPAPTLFRPPYGAVNAKVKASIPMAFMFWNEDPRDWAAETPKQVEAAVLAAARPGGVIDMHDIYHVTAKSLGPTIEKLKKEKFQFVTVSQLLDIKPGQRGDFFGRP